MKKSREKGGFIYLRLRDNIKKKVSGMLVKMRKKKDGWGVVVVFLIF